MKIPRVLFLALIPVLAAILAGCGGAPAVTSWPGLSIGPDGRVIAASASHIYQVDPTNGSEVSRTPSTAIKGMDFYAPPAFAPDGSMIAGSYDHSLYKFAAGAAQPDWTFAEADDRYIAQPLVVGDLILAPNADGNLFALSLEGQLRWSFKSEHGLWATPLVKDDVIYLAATDHRIYAINLQDGSVIWQTEDLGGELVATPALSEDGILYVGTFGSKNDDPEQASQLVAVNASNGGLAWKIPTKGWVWATPTMVDGVLYFGDQEGFLYAVDAQTHQNVWQPVQFDTTANRAIVGAPLVTQDRIYFANKAGSLFGVERATGVQKWVQAVGGAVYTSPLLQDNKILVAPTNFDALVVTFDIDGVPGWTFTPVKE